MSEFEKELDVKIKSGEIMKERYKTGCILSHFVSLKDIESTFKDWQPPKPLVVVPEDVDKAIKYLKKHNSSTFSDLGDILTEKGFGWLNDFQFKDRRFGFGGLNNKLFILSHLAITGYTVEKEQLFYLKNKITQEYLYDNDGHFSECGKEALGFDMFKVEFTKSEIEDMQTGSYEQIEVKVEEVE